MMRIKVPQTIVTFPKDGEIIVYNYLTRDAITCAPADVYWLTIAPEWTDIDEIVADHPHIEPQSLRRELLRLVDAGILLTEESSQAKTEASYRQFWELGMAAGLFHFSIMDNDYVDLSESVKKQKLRALSDPSPALFWRNSDRAIPLPESPRSTVAPLFEVMRRRRTNRNAKHEFITLEDLSECLFAGLGVTSFVQTETGMLPLKMTPSGGARNPFEAFVWVRDVEGLEPGVYHYSAIDHSLEKTRQSPNASPMDMLKGQDWADDMPAIIFLVAVLRRTMWKYNDPNAYRVVLIEAGHIAQNIMLACANNNLTACPTAALSHSQVSDMLALTDITQTPIYALLVGKPGENADIVMPNQHVRELRVAS
jgi:SagB-type dehydrogenase family enzyme